MENRSLPDPVPVSAETMQAIMDKILEDNRNVDSSDYGVNGRKTI